MSPVDVYNISGLIQRRAGQASFHVASEEHVRIEFRNMKAGERLAALAFDGNVVVTCFRGSFDLANPPGPLTLRELDQCVLPPGAAAGFECKEDGTLQLIWAPPFGVPRAV